MKSTLLVLVIAAVLLGVPAPPSSASQACKPVVGHFEAAIVPPGEGHCPNDPNAFCTAGRVWGGIQGTYEFVMSSLVPSGPTGVPTIFFFTGQSTVFLKSGDELRGTDTGSIDLPLAPQSFRGFASLITFDGGTGAMEDATGQIRLRGEFDPSAGPTGTTSGDYTGTLCSG